MTRAPRLVQTGPQGEREEDDTPNRQESASTSDSDGVTWHLVAMILRPAQFVTREQGG